ncbi:MAG: type II toxin-antitoxin system VapC family toxin [Propionibacteriaceae bacterium]|jgi:predicted nucleic-acid-binding protein|nr:type II toxin-antitoxin system VapC family toxin [Propionibacteriaceae bacterium]
MRVAVDTNVLVRAVMADDEAQAAAARALLAGASQIVVPLPVFCELVWVLRRCYGLTAAEAASVVEGLADAAEVEADRPAVEAGLALLRAGGDFADGAAAHVGRVMGGEQFESFDRQAVRLLQEQGVAAHLLTTAPKT